MRIKHTAIFVHIVYSVEDIVHLLISVLPYLRAYRELVAVLKVRRSLLLNSPRGSWEFHGDRLLQLLWVIRSQSGPWLVTVNSETALLFKYQFWIVSERENWFLNKTARSKCSHEILNFTLVATPPFHSLHYTCKRDVHPKQKRGLHKTGRAVFSEEI